jgi:Arc/MetJ-type ribon-helix-helix transcriptional regulator
MTKIYVTLSENSVEFIDRYRVAHGCQSSDEVISKALVSLQEIELESEHQADAREDNSIDPKVRSSGHNGIAVTLIVFFGVSLLSVFLLIGLGAFYPQANVILIKDTLPLVINSLTSILSLALAFYCINK